MEFTLSYSEVSTHCLLLTTLIKKVGGQRESNVHFLPLRGPSSPLLQHLVTTVPLPASCRPVLCRFHMQGRMIILIFLSLAYWLYLLLPSISANGRLSCFVKADWRCTQYLYLLSFISSSLGEFQMPPGGAENSTTLNGGERILFSWFTVPRCSPSWLEGRGVRSVRHLITSSVVEAEGGKCFCLVPFLFPILRAPGPGVVSPPSAINS